VSAAATIADVVQTMEELYPARWADAGDPVGLVVGDPASSVERVLLAVDPVQAIVDEAVALRAGLLLTHHPLLFRAVHSVAATTPKGRAVHDLVRQGIGLFVAHTNADSPPGGVSDSLARALGLRDVHPVQADPRDPLDKVVTFVPVEHTQRVLDALAAAGAGAIGDYDRCAFVTPGEGTFRPGDGAHPVIGEVGRIEVVDERRVEMVVPRHRREAVIAALRAAHPYEEPAFDVFEQASWASDRGTGRIGRLDQEMSLRAFVDHVVTQLPGTAVGARVSGELDAPVQTVAVVGGAGDFMLDTARAAEVDVFITSDLRHHPASELREYVGAPALVDVPHWAAEWTWLPVAARALTERLFDAGFDVACDVSTLCTDPWNYQRSIS
jgi:dinuclear metal center YbgI/SA1388 family protein